MEELNSKSIHKYAQDRDITGIIELYTDTSDRKPIKQGIFDSCYMNNHSLKSIKNGSFDLWTNLFLIQISSNQLKEIEKGSFKNLSKLETLDLNKNELDSKSINKELFIGLSSLTKLVLSSNKITH